MTRYLRRGCGGPGPPAALEGAWYQAASFRGGRGKLRARDGHRGESAASFTWLHDRHGVNIFVSASYVGTGCRRAGPPPKAGPAQAAVDSATEAPESGWFLAYSSSLGRRVIGEIIPESCIHLCEEPVVIRGQRGTDDLPGDLLWPGALRPALLRGGLLAGGGLLSRCLLVSSTGTRRYRGLVLRDERLGFHPFEQLADHHRTTARLLRHLLLRPSATGSWSQPASADSVEAARPCFYIRGVSVSSASQA